MKKSHVFASCLGVALLLLAGLACGSGGSSDGTTNLTPPSITAQPQDLTVTEYESASFSVVAAGSLPFTYQWMKNGTAISGAVHASYNIPSVALTDAGSYTVQVNNPKGPAVLSTAAVLTVNVYSGPPIILTQPKSQTVGVGASATFSVSAVGPGLLSYQWKKDGTNLTGATTTSYKITSAQLTDAGSYTVTVTNIPGHIDSQAAVLTVQNSSTGSFTITGDLHTPRSMHTATLLDSSSGQVLIAGGRNSSTGDLDSAEVYDPVQGAFTELAIPMTLPRSQHTATLLSDGTVLLAGGNSTGGVTDQVDLFDPANGGSFTSTGHLAVPRAQHTATLLSDGTILLVGGTNSNGGPQATAEIFDLSSGTGTLLTNAMAVPRFGHTMTDLGSGLFLIAGGTNALGNPIDEAELLDTTSQPFAFTPLTSAMTSPRSFHTDTLLNTGMVLLAGGQYASGYAVASAELFDPSNSSSPFTPCTQTMSDARNNHTATLLADGTVLLAGGFGNLGALNSAEIYDPGIDSFSTITGLNAARGQHTATVMGSYGILFAGGYNSNSLAGAEVFH